MLKTTCCCTWDSRIDADFTRSAKILHLHIVAKEKRIGSECPGIWTNASRGLKRRKKECPEIWTNDPVSPGPVNDKCGKKKKKGSENIDRNWKTQSGMREDML